MNAPSPKPAWAEDAMRGVTLAGGAGIRVATRRASPQGMGVVGPPDELQALGRFLGFRPWLAAPRPNGDHYLFLRNDQCETLAELARTRGTT